MSAPSLLKRREIIDALRLGVVPRRGLELFAVGLDRFETAIDEELDSVAAGRGRFKAVRGEYGTGKTFFARWLEHRALQRGFATAVVQIGEPGTPLHQMELVYRQAALGLQTKEWSDGAFRSLIDRWFFQLEEEVLAQRQVDPNDDAAVERAVGNLLEQRLRVVSGTQPEFAAALRACHTARVRGDQAVAEGLVTWLMGKGSVGAGVLRAANLKGDLEHDSAAGFFRGELEVLKQTGRKGLVLVLDEVETIQRIHADRRDRSLSALRQLIDDLVADRYPGLYVLVTGTPLFFDGPQGIRRLPPLAQRLHTDFGPDPRFDASRAPQIRLQPFDLDKLVTVGRRVRELYPAESTDRVMTKVDDGILRALASTVGGAFAGKMGAAPRIYLRRLVGLLDQVEEHPDFDPKIHATLKVDPSEMNDDERAAAGVSRSVEDIQLDVSPKPGAGVE
jgi:hypothetical protein